MVKNREAWIDFAKGLGIIFVVMGHAGDNGINPYLSWVAMPLFFMVSGFLFKPVHGDAFKKWSLKRAKQLMIPYFAYGVVIALLILIKDKFDFGIFFENLGLLLYGGDILKGSFAVFWFITCLFLTQLLFAFISRYPRTVQFAIVAACYVLSFVVDWSALSVPWNADVVPLALVYYAIGYYFKDIIVNSIKKIGIPLLALAGSVAFVLLKHAGAIDFRMDMKYNVYGNFVFALLIPLSCLLVLFALSYCLCEIIRPKYNVMVKLGGMTMTVMYLHFPINNLVNEAFHIQPNLVEFTLMGIFIPVAAHFLLKKIPVFEAIFINWSPKPAKSLN